MIAIVIITDEDIVDWQRGREYLMDGLDGLPRLRSARDVGLVGDDEDSESVCFQVEQGGSNLRRVDRRDNDADIGDFRGVATIAPYDSQNFRADTLCVLQSNHQIRADIFFEVAAADGKHKHQI